MEKASTVTLNEASTQNLAARFKNFVMSIPYPEVNLVVIYAIISIIIINIMVFYCFSKDLSMFENIESTTLPTLTFALGALLSAILKIITSYLYYIIITELQSLYKNLYIYCLIRAIPLLMIFISFFVFLLTLREFPISFRKINKFNTLGIIFYLPFILELSYIILMLFSSIAINIKLQTEVLILIIGTYIEVLHIIYILMVPRLVIPYNDIENEFNTDFEDSHLRHYVVNHNTDTNNGNNGNITNIRPSITNSNSFDIYANLKETSV